MAKPLPRPNHRIKFEVEHDGVTTYTVQRRRDDGSWETVLIPSNLTPAVYLYREAAEEHLKALRAA